MTRAHNEESLYASGLAFKRTMSLVSPAIFDIDDDDTPLSFKRARTYVGNKPSVVNPVIVGNDDDEVPLSFKRASASVKNKPSVVNPVIVGNDDDEDDYEDPRSFKRATTFVKNRTWGANSAIFDNDDDEAPLFSSKRASTSVKIRPNLSQQKALEDLDRRMEQYFYNAQFRIEDSARDEMTQKSEDHAKSGSGNGGRPKKKHKGTASIPAIEDTMFMGQKSSQQGQQYSISRCLEVLHGMDDVSDEIKVLASDVLKDAASREFFLCYESRLRGMWLKKEVAKLGAQFPA